MKKNSAILLMAGMSSRFGNHIDKVLYEINEKPLFIYSLDVLYKHPLISQIIIACKKELMELVTNMIEQNYFDKSIKIVEGGKTRSESVRNALKLVNNDTVLIHDAARPLITSTDITNLVDASNEFECGTLYHKVFDTIKDTTSLVKTVNRDNLKAVSTPQFFNKSIYQKILNNNNDNITDEITLLEKEVEIGFVLESRPNKKVTTVDDLEYINYVLSKNNVYRVGHSFDFHSFEENRKLFLGGVEFNVGFGLKGHSDADVVYHVVAESIMGALGIGDLGTLFPDTDPAYLNMDSSFFVKTVMEETKKQDMFIENIDVIVYLEKPNLKDYKRLMAKNIKELTGCTFVNVKATTLEKKGLIGRGEGIASEAVVLVKKVI